MASDIVNHLNAVQTATPAEQGVNRSAVMSPRGLQSTEREVKEASVETESANAEPLEAVVENVNDYVQNVQRQLSFSIEKESGKTVIRVVDSATDELVRQIPSEEFLELAKALEKAKGILLQAEA
ncbi:MAG: flagellar protein FlaG [Gammaproteobacteria bacterium]|nr:flagellar protein FlaG [Gammaproteobacteria bacterium]